MAGLTDYLKVKAVFLFLFIFALVTGKIVKAQKYHIKQYSVQNGLISDHLNAIYQTGDGFIMIATANNGLMRFDGVSGKRYSTQEGLNGNDVKLIFEDRKKNLWVTTSSGGLGRVEADSVYYPYKDRQIQHKKITDMAGDRYHRLWLATQEEGIFVGNQFDHISQKNGLPSNKINDLWIGDEREMLVATAGGLAIVDTGNLVVKEILEGTTNLNCRNIFVHGETLWIGTDNGVLKINQKNNYEHIEKLAETEIGPVTDIISNGTGDLMIGTQNNGIFELEESLVNHITINNDLPSNRITDLFRDDENRTWVATADGGASLFLDEAFVQYLTIDDLGTDDILSVHASGSDSLWVGTKSGLALVNTSSMNIKHLRLWNKNKPVWNISGDGNKLILVSCNEIFQFVPTEKKLLKMELKGDGEFDQIYDIHRLKKGSFLLGTNRGLFRIEGQNVLAVKDDKLKGTVIWHLMEDQTGTIWISTNKGMVKAKNGSYQTVTELEDKGYDGLYRYALEDKKGNVWLGSNQGIIEYHKDSQSTVLFDNNNGMFSVNTQFLWIDKNDQLWHGTSAGLHKLNLEKYWSTGKMDIAHYGLDFYRLGMGFNHLSVTEQPDGTVWFGSSEGLLKYDPENGIKDRYGPDIYFTDINLGINQEDGFEYNTSIDLEYPITSSPNIDLSHWENNLNFTFKGVDYQNPEKIVYRYKLEGKEKRWSKLTQSNTAEYRGLEPGKYKFLVQARDINEVWSSHPASVNVTISEPVWSTYWFNGILVICLAGLFYGGSRVWLNTYEKKKLKHLVDYQTKELREGLKEKEVLLAEIHHRVKNNLAVISGLLELQQDSVIEESAIRALVEAKNRIQSIAIIHEKLYQNDTLANINFQDYIEELADIIACSYNMMDSKITLHVETEEIPITIDQSIPCGLILNEVLSNAYEHAFTEQKEGNIFVSLSEQNREVTMIIKDDGKGLPCELKEKQAERLGLSLVKTLTRQLGGSLKIENREGAYFEINFIRDTKPNGHLS